MIQQIQQQLRKLLQLQLRLKIYCKIWFNGGSKVSSKEVTSGSKVSKPSNPTRTGYKFGGWTLNNKAYDFNSKVTSNITLVAKWTAKTYTVKVSSVDEYSPARILSVYEDGSKISLNKLTIQMELCYVLLKVILIKVILKVKQNYKLY